MISFICASYNYEKYISQTIDSVLGQTYPDWELIMVDDGSSDNSVKVIDSYCKKDNRIKLFTHENNQNKGLIETLKLGIKKANGEWAAFVESDDTITPDYLEKKLDVIKKFPDVKFIYNDVNIFGKDDDLKPYIKYQKKIHEILDKKEYPCKFKEEFFENNIVPTFSCVMIEKKLLNSLDFDKCALPKCLDYYLWTQVAKDNKLFFLNEKLTNWRRNKESYVNKKEVKVIKDKYFRKVQLYENIEKSKIKIIVRKLYFFTVLGFYIIASGLIKDILRMAKGEKRL